MNRRDPCYEEHIHARRLRILDERRQERHDGRQCEIPTRLEKAPPGQPGQEDEQYPQIADGSRKVQGPGPPKARADPAIR